ncbi:MAG TPA: 30S ribosomal protein S16 [Candidatus Moranbacteria bacterium]|nr:30S ribosomal protein S16 [Candidatus Moranbacteria bacterium]
MLAIRFARVGRKNRAQFRVVLQEHRIAPGGRHVAVLGSYDPARKVAVLKADKIKEWISKGAQPSDSAYNLFVKEGIIEGKKKPIKMKRPVTKEAPAEEAPKAETAAETKTEEVKAEVAETKAEEVKAEEVKEEVKTEEPKAEEAKAE